MLSPYPASVVSSSSEEPDEPLRRAHNRLSLRLEKEVTPEQLRDLKQYFYKAPLDVNVFGKISSFVELWNALDSYRTIKPGKYSHLKTAMDDIGAQACLATIKKFENKEFKDREGSQRSSTAVSRDRARQHRIGHGSQESEDLRQQVERERELRSEAEKQRDLAIKERELSHARHENAIQEARKGENKSSSERKAIPENLKDDGTQTEEAQRDVQEVSADLNRLDEIERLKELNLKERELSHINRVEAMETARTAIEHEKDRRAHVERELESPNMLKMAIKEKQSDSADLRNGKRRMATKKMHSVYSRHRKQGSGAGCSKVSDNDDGDTTGNWVLQAPHREVKSRSRSESDTPKASHEGWESKPVGSSWDETKSGCRPRSLGKNPGSRLDVRYLGEWRLPMSFGEEELDCLPSASNAKNSGDIDFIASESVKPKNGSEKRCDQTDVPDSQDLDAILNSVLRCLETKNLPLAKQILNPLDTKARKAVTSLKLSQQTVLFKACVKGQVDFVEYFLSECGAETEALGEYISEAGVRYVATPLWWASYSNQSKILETLVAHGACVNAEIEVINSTAILSACAVGNVEVVKYLAAHGADLQRPNANGETCLHKAVQNLDLCLFLLNHGAKVNQVDGFGRTPLHDAVDVGPTEVVHLLARRGADVRVKDIYGETALEIASRNGRDKVAELLLKIMELNRTSGKGNMK